MRVSSQKWDLYVFKLGAEGCIFVVFNKGRLQVNGI